MSNYQGHAIGGTLFGVIYIAALYYFAQIDVLTQKFNWFQTVPLSVPIMILAVLFGLWPDVDTNSKGQDIFYKIFFGFDLLLMLAGSFEAAAYVGLLAMFPVLGKHRGWTHSRISMLLVPSPFLLLPYLYNPSDKWAGAVYYGAAVSGYASHLVFDKLFFRKPKPLRQRLNPRELLD